MFRMDGKRPKYREKDLEKIRKKLMDHFAKELAIEHIDIKSSFDHDGDDALFLDIYHHPDFLDMDAGFSMNCLREIQRFLLKQDIEEFPYIRHRKAGEKYQHTLSQDIGWAS